MLMATAPSIIKHVVNQGHDGRQTEGHALEPHPEIDDDADPAKHERVDGLSTGCFRPRPPPMVFEAGKSGLAATCRLSFAQQGNLVFSGESSVFNVHSL